MWERTEGEARQAKKGRTGERFRHHRAFAHSHPILPFSLLEPTWRKQSLFVGQLRACGWRSVCASLASDHGEAPSRGDGFVCPQWTEPSVHFSGISLVGKERREGGRDKKREGQEERGRGETFLIPPSRVFFSFPLLKRFDGSGYIHSLRLDAETQTANYSGQFVQTPILKVRGGREGGREGGNLSRDSLILPERGREGGREGGKKRKQHCVAIPNE